MTDKMNQIKDMNIDDAMTFFNLSKTQAATAIEIANSARFRRDGFEVVDGRKRQAVRVLRDKGFLTISIGWAKGIGVRA